MRVCVNVLVKKTIASNVIVLIIIFVIIITRSGSSLAGLLQAELLSHFPFAGPSRCALSGYLSLENVVKAETWTGLLQAEHLNISCWTIQLNKCGVRCN